MFKQLIFIFSLVFFVAVFASAQEQPKTEKSEKQECTKEAKCCSMKGKQTSDVSETSGNMAWNKVCPVKGGEIESDSPTYEYKGKVYGFCCSGCESKFKKDPESYLKNLNDDGSEFIKKS